MKTEIVKHIKEFAFRVLKGGENVTPQETAILPEILKMLGKIRYVLFNSRAYSS